jgi:FMN phosphatase YigB (HAD superfamily)
METGVLLAALAAARSPLPARIIGKPHGLLFEIALARFGCGADQAVMIGDNDATDMLGARRAGITAIRIGPDGDAASLAEIVGNGVAGAGARN